MLSPATVGLSLITTGWNKINQFNNLIYYYQTVFSSASIQPRDVNRIDHIIAHTCIIQVEYWEATMTEVSKNMRTSENDGGPVKSQAYWSGRPVNKKVKGKPCTVIGASI